MWFLPPEMHTGRKRGALTEAGDLGTADQAGTAVVISGDVGMMAHKMCLSV
jgi:hypothetical protein